MNGLFAQWHALRPPAQEVDGVQIVFGASRTRLRGAGLAGLPSRASFVISAHPSYGGPSIVEAQWPPGEIEHLSVLTVAEEVPLVPVSVYWGRSEPAARVEPAPYAEQLARIADPDVRKSMRTALQARTTRSRAVFMELRTAAAPEKPQESFFAALDAATLLDRDATQPRDPVEAADRLRLQLEKRLSSRLRGEMPAPLAADDVALISKLQKDLYEAFWPELKSGLAPAAVDDIAEGYRRFASGEFKLRGRDNGFGEPDSAYFFFFAEFALAAAESGPDAHRPLWRALLPGLVAAQAVYVRAYAPRDGTPRTWSAWRWDNINANDAPAHRDEWLKAGEAAYAQLRSGAIDTRTLTWAREALRDDPLAPLRLW